MTAVIFRLLSTLPGVTSRLCAFALAASLIVGNTVGEARAEDGAVPTDWFHVIRLDDRTFAISEPKYWQQNVSYLFVGSRRALLFDTGPGVYSIRAVVESLTHLPVTVVPSHLHFDHLGRVEEFRDVALVDLPALRAQSYRGMLVETPDQYMLQVAPKLRVTRWIRDGGRIDLGDRVLQLISTPGHTPDSVTLIDAAAKRVFSGDLINRIVTLCDVPGSDIRDTAKSIAHILKIAPKGSRAYEAHAEMPLEPAELEALAAGSESIATGVAKATPMCLGGQPMLAYAVGAFSILLPEASDERLRPLASAGTTLDWQGGPCSADAARK